MNYVKEQGYLQVLRDILEYGSDHEDRTGTGTYRLFGAKIEFPLDNQFPLFTTKFVPFKLVASELLWFLKSTKNHSLNINDLKRIHPNNIWDEWADENGNLGPVYGTQWRDWNSNGIKVDQIHNCINTIMNNPDSRRNIVTAWNPGEISAMKLPPCHILSHFIVDEGKLNCLMYQRSCDMFLGVPFNVASYSLLTYMIAYITNLKRGKFVWVGGDVHIYKNHVEQVKTQLDREVKIPPRLNIVGDPIRIDDFTMDSFDLINYEYHPAIKAEISV
jgi:thymidylate synthase